ncbi:MAG: nitronate monooxygenase, partial [Bacteroidia bacterium]|nr:nitronate monooxygenase [Bacteroidia bacterium]
MILGADGVQIGSRFAISEESSAHPGFKKLVTSLGEGSTMLSLKQLAPVRLIKNHFWEETDKAEKSGAPVEFIQSLLGKGRAKKGIFEGDLVNGELEIGQVATQINKILPVKTIMENLISEWNTARKELSDGEKFRF